MSYQYEYLENIHNPEYENMIEKIEDLKDSLQLKDMKYISISDEDIYNNVSIEGNSIERKEVTVLLERDVTIRGRNIKDHLQIKNYENVLNALKTFVMNTNLIITPDVIKTIHQIVTEGELNKQESGQYRQEPVHIRYTDYIPPNEWEIEGFVEELCSKLYEKDSFTTPFEKICEFKRNFERIHPFVDGNGRTGRILMNLLFLQNGYSYLSFPSEERDLYFSSLENNTFHIYAAKHMLQMMKTIQKTYQNHIEEQEER